MLIQWFYDIRLHLGFLFRASHLIFVRFFAYHGQLIFYDLKDLLWESRIFVNSAFHKWRTLRLSWMRRFLTLFLLRLKISLFCHRLGLWCKYLTIFHILYTLTFESCWLAFLNWFYCVFNNFRRALHTDYVFLKHLYSCEWFRELTFILLATPFLAIAVYLLQW